MITAEYVSDSEFKVVGEDLTDELSPGTKIKVYINIDSNNSRTIVFSEIKSASLTDGDTVVELEDAVVTEDINGIQLSGAVGTKVTSADVRHIVECTQDEYDALTPRDDTLYLITED